MEVAGMMYGVSMGKDGTSKVLAQRLEHPQGEHSEERPAELAAVAVPEPDVVG
jgi:hypothetical protein